MNEIDEIGIFENILVINMGGVQGSIFGAIWEVPKMTQTYWKPSAILNEPFGNG